VLNNRIPSLDHKEKIQELQAIKKTLLAEK